MFDYSFDYDDQKYKSHIEYTNPFENINQKKEITKQNQISKEEEKEEEVNRREKIIKSFSVKKSKINNYFIPIEASFALLFGTRLFLKKNNFEFPLSIKNIFSNKFFQKRGIKFLKTIGNKMLQHSGKLFLTSMGIHYILKKKEAFDKIIEIDSLNF